MRQTDRVQELVPIEIVSGNYVVDARSLHQELKVGAHFREWIRRRIRDYGFCEGWDFWKIMSQNCDIIKRSAGRPAVAYKLSLDMAKEIAMLENNQVGRAVRRYFIEVEKRYRDWTDIWLPRLDY